MAKFKKPTKEKVSELVKRIMRFCSSSFNEIENTSLTEDFKIALQQMRERNSQKVFNEHYLPMVVNEIICKEGYLPTPNVAFPKAASLMLEDIATGVLNEFYQFNEAK